MAEAFRKRIFTPATFFLDLTYLVKNFPAVLGAVQTKRVSRAFAEKTMLAATAVNECKLCARMHSEMAYQSGVDQKEVMALLHKDLSGKTAADEELTALIYAQHYAETSGNPAPEMIRRLTDAYGEETASDIRILIRLIVFGNLSGNTFSAFSSRLKGVKASDSSLWFELIFVVLSAPALLYFRTGKVGCDMAKW